MFRRIAKPKDAGWFEANKQFIAPLPIPNADHSQRADVAKRARELQRLHTLRRDLLTRIARRISTVAQRPRPLTWLFAGLMPPQAREASAPAGLDTAERRAWARTAYEAELATRCTALAAAFRPGVTLDAALVDGELRFLVEGIAVVDRVFVTPAEGAFLLAQWKVLASTLVITERIDGKKLANALRSLALPDNPVVVEQVVAAVRELDTCEAAIRKTEAEMNELVFALYGLTPAERALVAAG